MESYITLIEHIENFPIYGQRKLLTIQMNKIEIIVTFRETSQVILLAKLCLCIFLTPFQMINGMSFILIKLNQIVDYAFHYILVG
jgi:hypothetical protein